MESLKRNRRTWSRRETLAFLDSYSKRQDEFKHPRRKKNAWANVLLDLTSSGVLEEPTTTTMLESRMKSLLAAYKASIDNESRTGAAPCVAPFLKEMEEIFGSRPIISNRHSINLSGTPIRPLSMPTSSSDNVEEVGHCSNATEDVSRDVRKDAPSTSAGFTPNRPTIGRSCTPQKLLKMSRKRLSPRQSYYHKKIALAEEANKQRGKLLEMLERHEQAKERRHQEKLSMMEQILAYLNKINA